MKRVNTYESGGDSDDEFIEYVEKEFKILSWKKKFFFRKYVILK